MNMNSYSGSCQKMVLHSELPESWDLGGGHLRDNNSDDSGLQPLFPTPSLPLQTCLFGDAKVQTSEWRAEASLEFKNRVTMVYQGQPLCSVAVDGTPSGLARTVHEVLRKMRPPGEYAPMQDVVDLRASPDPSLQGLGHVQWAVPQAWARSQQHADAHEADHGVVPSARESEVQIIQACASPWQPECGTALKPWPNPVTPPEQIVKAEKDCGGQGRKKGVPLAHPRQGSAGRPGPLKRQKAEVDGPVSAVTSNGRTTTFSMLPLELMVKIFQYLDPTVVRRTLPLVCRAWRESLELALPLYNHMDIDVQAEIRDLNKAGGKVRAESVTRWMVKRKQSIWSLRFRNLNPGRERGLMLSPHQAPALHTFNGASLAALLGELSWLQELVIEDCHALVTTDTFKAIGRLHNLRVLCLKGIRRELEGDDFAALIKLRKLEELVLDCDQAPTEGPGVQEMKWGLQGFPEGMEHLVNMTHLTLSCHPCISQLPESLSQLSKLQVLNLDFCQLTDLPACLGDLTSLTTLDVEGNTQLGAWNPYSGQASSLHSNLERLSSLRYLNLIACGLKSLPKVLAQLHCLQTLDLEENDLGNPVLANWGSATSWTSLKCLNIASCCLTEIPHSLLSLSSLRILDLTNNLLTNDGLPEGLSSLSQLKAIGLKRNRLTEVPRVLGSLTALQEIYLEDNVSLEVHRSLDFLVELPSLRILMMGKATTYSPASVHFLSELMRKLTRKHPTRDVLRVSYPGNAEWEPTL